MGEFTRYKERSIGFIEIWNFEQWRIKIYKICEEEFYWNEDYLDIAKSIAQKELLKISDHNYKIGFIVIHIAKMFNQIILDWWANENELRHLVFKASADKPAVFENITSTGEAFCIWELRVIEHERHAWIKNVLKNSERPHFADYCSEVLNSHE